MISGGRERAIALGILALVAWIFGARKAAAAPALIYAVAPKPAYDPVPDYAVAVDFPCIAPSPEEAADGWKCRPTEAEKDLFPWERDAARSEPVGDYGVGWE